MRIFVAGATGAIGRRLVPLLVSTGHSVIGMTRSPGKADLIRKLGAEPAIADGLDAMAVHAAVISAKPDVIVHEMTDLTDADYRHFDSAFAVSNRLRTEGTDYLLAAARDAGVQRFVAQSYCGWPYAKQGGPIKTETDPLDPNPAQEFRATLEAIEYLEDTVTASPAPEGIILRYGALYGADTGILEDSMVDQISRRRVPLIGDGNGWWSFLHVEDAARATALAIERGKPGQIYNIADDDPAPVHKWLPALAKLLGAKPPHHIPAWLARLFAGEALVIQITEVRAGSNAKAKRELGWQLHFASWRQGFAAALQQRERHRQAA